MATASKVQFFYTLFGAGFSETLYNIDQPSKIIGTDVPGYLDARLAVATKDLQAMYVRIVIPPPARTVQFVDLSAQSRVGTFNGTSAPADDAILCRLQLNSILAQGVSRFWLHGIPGQFIQGQFYVPSASWLSKLSNFGGALGSLGNGWRWQVSTQHTIAQRQYIAGITPNPHRGYTIQPVTGAVLPTAPGSIVYVGGQGATILGMNGRKIVTQITPGLTPSFQVGGAVPVGTYQPNSAYYYNITFELDSLQFPNGLVPVRLADHDVGRPFGLPRGRRPDLLSLRR